MELSHAKPHHLEIYPKPRPRIWVSFLFKEAFSYCSLSSKISGYSLNTIKITFISPSRMYNTYSDLGRLSFSIAGCRSFISVQDYLDLTCSHNKSILTIKGFRRSVGVRLLVMIWL